MAVWKTRVGQGHSTTHPHNELSQDRQNEKGHLHKNRKDSKTRKPRKMMKKKQGESEHPHEKCERQRQLLKNKMQRASGCGGGSKIKNKVTRSITKVGW